MSIHASFLKLVKENVKKLSKNGRHARRYIREMFRSPLFGRSQFKYSKIHAAEPKKTSPIKGGSFYDHVKLAESYTPLRRRNQGRVQLGDEQLMAVVSEFLWLFS